MENLKKILFGIITGLLIFATAEMDLFASGMINNFKGNIINLNKVSSSPLDFIQVRRGGGGSRSFGGSRSRSSSKSTRSSKSSTSKSNLSPAPPSKKPSFGGTRMSASAAKAKYGTPRKTSTVTSKNSLGENVNYRVNDYGGFSSGLMMGYMTGQMTSWMWMGSMMYSRPVYVTNDDGSTSVYPPTFSFTRLIILLLVIYIIYRIIKAIFFKKKAAVSGGSSGSFG
jgi:hypothetical protein